MEDEQEKKISTDTRLYPRKMIVKHGAKHFLLDTSDVMYCYSNNKVAYIVDASNKKYIAEKNLMHLEDDLDPKLFFRANRTHIINFNFIRSFATHDKNKIKVELRTDSKEDFIIISQTRVVAFKEWIYKQL